ncbi:MAG: nucleoside deaminase [Bacteroidetes bacterium]|nr:nucleoside deaminase [Bacteroidota bacterium]
MKNKSDTFFLERAIAIALESVERGGGPFGAVVVENGKIIAESGNCVRQHNDPTAHAEVEAIRRACEIKQSHSLENCVLYASCEPCPMCLGAIYWARLQRVVFSATRHHAARIGFDDNFIYTELGKDIIERSIKTVHIDLPSAHALFEVWERKEDRDNY